MNLPDDFLDPVARRVLLPGRFFAAGTALALRHDPAEALRWELFQGRLLDEAHTRRVRTFSSWGLFADGAAEPLVSLKHDATGRQLHVVRSVEGYAWESIGASGGVIEGREVRRWLRELVATFDLAAFASAEALAAELEGAVALAVHGARLPLTPVEAPLPAFSFGRLAYGPDDSAPDSADALLRRWLGPALLRSEGHRTFEAWLRAEAGPPAEAADRLAGVWDGLGRAPADLARLARCVFDDISLSPWTGAVPFLLDVMDHLADRSWLPADALLDFQSSLLRLVGRHLTAYDLVVFHHRGANYPDALLLDELLRRYLRHVEQAPAAFTGPEHRLRRRALRQGYLLRRRYEGHPVPEVPTSPGERMRAYPGSVPRVHEEEIVQPMRRRKRLFAGTELAGRLTPAVRSVLRQSFDDLDHPDERRELGAAIYLDRPLGGAKEPVEPDATPLVASLAFSQAVAVARLQALGADLGLPGGELERVHGGLALTGVPLAAIGPAPRPGTVTLADAARVSADFVFLHTQPASRRAFLAPFDWSALSREVDASRLAEEPWLLARAPAGPGLMVYDAGAEPWLHVEPALEAGYRSRAGLELPAGGLRVTGVSSKPPAGPVAAPLRTPPRA